MQAVTSRGVDLNEANQASAGDVIYNFLWGRTMITKYGQNNYEETPIKLKLTWMLLMT